MHERILISDIDLTDERYRISSDNDIISLAQSIKNMGLINIPVVKANDHGFIVVSGFGRIKAMVHNGTEEIQARVLPQNRAGVSSARTKNLQHDKGAERAGELHQDETLPQNGQAELDLDLDFEAVLISISDNAFQREFDTMEQAKAVVLLSKFMNFTEIAEKSSFIFNAKMNSLLVQKLFTTGSMPKE
ncbi:MAG: ParB N-terminal domain-containing protein, partial [Thermodesulfobacteriota bacterium]|nr:ParB N-terminal domain-containing protein [Thermodesulfobacteriota bacterium]